MSRRLPSGTPTRTEGYVYPDDKRVWSWAGGAAAVFVLLVGLYFAGAGATLSPGPVVAAHAPIEADCILCHKVGAEVPDIRCERCHDSAGTARLANASHVLYGSGDARKARRAKSVACISCHTDHRGRDHALWQADDRECGTCHGFSSLDAHPEFAAVTAATQTGLGIKFPHQRHIVDVQRELGTGCAACHVPNTNLTGFEPIDFDRHCASCHAPDGFLVGRTGKMSAELIVSGNDVPRRWRQDALVVETSGPPRRRLLQAFNLAHEDRWVRYNALKLSREVAPEVERAEIAALQAQLAWLEQQRRESPLRALSAQQLAGLEVSLMLQLDNAEERLAVAASAGDDGAALAHLAEEARSLAGAIDAAGLISSAPSLVPPDGSLATELRELQARLEAIEGPEPEPAAAADRVERRKEELLALLDAIAARGDESMQERAGDLRAVVAAISAEPTDEPAEVTVLQSVLDDLDDALRTVIATGDPQARVGAAQVAGLRDLASRRIGGGLAPVEFANRRQELLDLLDAIERRSGDELALGVSQLRSTVLALRIGDSGADDLRRRVESLRRTLQRVRLERELAARDDGGDLASRRARDRPLALGSQRDLAAVDAEAAEIQARLDELRRGPRGSVAIGAEERRLRLATLSALYAPCLKCHEQGAARLAPARIARPVMANSVFNHAPHVTQVDCAACHGDPSAEDPAARRVYASSKASDVNVPGVVECGVCHNPSDVSDGCETCHRYHPPSIDALLRYR